ncbi:4-hydroxyphenylpyruvate dioxygenase [Oscillatoriales cyanobacterium LEGE 11467]|uniref:4-hydroxyphenylpyruvate dioxygenase n=1 Tax=Zarconia navalis LEGE 11467 TaxID=1828826 RepID=A0A928ZAL0_9CYAN|nr:4-hydroxyphenylpyruvate dioxygenase [Zarconia navalis]MBE9042788.1 4-hydroxyphenylpyruvate dioxygenase [Zarconia navalis LEGE 11467]
MGDFCPIQGFDHLELYVGNARQAALFYAKGLGFTQTAYRGLKTGDRKVASYVMEQGQIRLVLSTALSREHPISRSVLQHGDAISTIALRVPDAVRAYRETTARGAVGAIPPTEEEDAGGILRYAAIRIYGNTQIKFIDRRDYTGVFAPGFEATHLPPTPDVGLQDIDHIVGNVERGTMDRWAQFFAETLGFELLAHFDDKIVSTAYSALMSKVMVDGTGRIKLPVNEPASGKRTSQIEEYLTYNGGAGVQHVAFATDNIVKTVSQLQASGIEFLGVPPSYYRDLEARVGNLDVAIEKLAKLGILVDRDRDGYLFQIFTQPVVDRPTLFFEVIERHGSRGFGEGNFKALFESIEREQALRGNL